MDVLERFNYGLSRDRLAQLWSEIVVGEPYDMATAMRFFNEVGREATKLGWTPDVIAAEDD